MTHGPMSAPWPAERVTALAPDARSLAAARGLADRWSDTGYLGDALWGRCRGTQIYETVVDMSGPASRCSCPSRKFPCKHALSLLLAWSAGAVPEAQRVADFAESWLSGRVARPAPVARTANPATAEQRRVRVTAGLEELDLWLGDQIRTGLAQTDRSFRAFEAVAARMVDAQAPAVASVLRRLPGTVVTRADWPARMLREFAGLHLLVAAHRRLDELPPGLRASVRTHIGYPTPAESVRAEPRVRDEWMTLGVRVTEDERLYTRRTWLYGRHTHRWAVLVDHSFGDPTFAATAPALGFQSDADLHFYPAAAPLRALWGTRHGADEPFTTLPKAPDTAESSSPGETPVPQPAVGHSSTARRGPVARALEEHAAALGADPWLRGWPVLLRNVVPVAAQAPGAEEPTGEGGLGRWRVVDASGAALPLVAGAEPWMSLAVSGGYPVAVAGEWTADGLVPVSVFTSGECVGLESEGGQGKEAASESPDELVSVALLGTARRAPDPSRLPEPVAAAASALDTDPAFLLLESAALRDSFAHGGVRADTADPPSAAVDDDRPALPRAVAARLSDMLRDRSPFLPEWFAATAARDFRAPDALCPQVLTAALTTQEHREQLLRLAGARGRWLAEQHPGWRNLLSLWPSDDDGDDLWRHGTPAQRRSWLARLRHRDPDAAREILAESWASEPGAEKADLLGILADGLGTRDESLLETALDDRRAEVRRTAASLLTVLPDSAFARRMRHRAREWVVPNADGSLARIAVPDDLDADARCDGITDRTVEFAYRWNGAPDLAAGRLRQLVAATPLDHWAAVLGPPATALRVTVEERFRQPLFDGWVDAALAHGDPDWAAALFAGGIPSDTALLRRRELFAELAAEDRVRHLLRLDGSWLSELEALLPAAPHPWPQALAQHVLLLLFERARVAAGRTAGHGVGPAAHRSLLAAAAAHLPVDAADAASALAARCEDPAWSRAFDRLATDLTFRSEMLEELP
ncbi:DUF5691 domain-containing protein [Nocardia puris]|uniref:SWIM zinc finger protein n=2 Tax=Nocardia puris TaxID=208602 RepID=A0A366DR31_9NOCA|nr:DUF5691 domain-containing protein [Nocardia puris]RBO92550.1 SWIM zinc finger protein [Nocardia puris]